jgi:succinoglycan biosynthesis transport protein ExoP
LAIAGFGGAVLGLGIALFRDISDRVFRTSGQIETKLLTNSIAMVPMLKIAKKTTSRRQRGSDTVGRRTIVREQSPLWAVVDSPLSRFAEAMRSIKLAVDLNAVGKSSKAIGFTSSLPNEGKSTVAANVAQLIARTGAQVILVDCDLRNPWLSRSLVRGAKLGIFDVISGNASLEETVWKDPSTNLVFLPAGAKPRLSDSSDILGSDAIKELFEKLRLAYDWVVVDLSPLAPIVDVRSTTDLVDSYVLIIEWGRTKIGVVEHALNTAKGVYENLLGAVLNKVDVRALSRYEGGHGYYYRKHYSQYGYTD